MSLLEELEARKLKRMILSREAFAIDELSDFFKEKFNLDISHVIPKKKTFHVYYWVPDHSKILRALDKIYKLKGYYKK